jgi:hypothetical protein
MRTSVSVAWLLIAKSIKSLDVLRSSFTRLRLPSQATLRQREFGVMSEMTWAERIESTSEAGQRNMGFGPFFIHLGQLATLLDSITRTPHPNTGPAPWPVAPATGWRTHRLNDEWSLTAWCALGGEWVFHPSLPDKQRKVYISEACKPEQLASVVSRLNDPLQCIAVGEAFAFCDELFIIPDEPFVMNSFRFHVPNREPLDLFIGFRGHPLQYPEIITPGIYRAHNKPTEESARLYRRKARVASNVVKQAVFERENVVLTNVQARGVLQHYGIIGATDVLDLTYDVNIAKWFALNVWDEASGGYRPKCFVEHTDHAKAYDEHSLVYTVVARAIGTQAELEFAEELANHGRLTFSASGGGELTRQNRVALPPRNLSPLWSVRAKRQSGFGLLGVGPRDDDGWGSVLGIYEHAFHPTFSPNGWDRIGGPSLRLGGSSFKWDEDTSVLSDEALPEDDECIKWIRTHVRDLERRFNL